MYVIYVAEGRKPDISTIGKLFAHASVYDYMRMSVNEHTANRQPMSPVIYRTVTSN